MRAASILIRRVIRKGGLWLTLWLSACAGTGPPAESTRAVRISEVMQVRSEAPRRGASLQLVREALEADAQGQPDQALSRYERAVRIDPQNPYAFLALARFRLDQGDAALARASLDQAQLLVESNLRIYGVPGEVPANATAELLERSRAHLEGLRGQLLQAEGREREGAAWLERARQLDPEIWGDADLSASELH